MFPSPILPFIRESEHSVRGPWRLAERRLLDYLLMSVEAGGCTLIVEGRPHELVPGDFALVQPDELHSFEAPDGTTIPYAHLDVFYNPRRDESFPTPAGRVDLSGLEDLMQPRLNDIRGIRVPTRFRPSEAARFRQAFTGMVDLSQSPDPLDQLEAQSRATEIVTLLLREFTTSSREPQVTTSLGWMTSYLSLRLGEELSVKDLATRAHLSPSRFAAVFKEQHGMPPHAYLTRLRVQHARSLLATTDTSQAEIASLCGFADVPHFSKVFKREAGVAPGAYRRATRSQARPDRRGHQTHHPPHKESLSA
jgi:AraC-like DNA-binding protein